MKRPFAWGEKVRVYDGELTHTFIITKIDPNYIYYDNHRFHPKQCRRLVKRKRRSVWIFPVFEYKGKPGTEYEVRISTIQKDGWTEFREAKGKG